MFPGTGIISEHFQHNAFFNFDILKGYVSEDVSLQFYYMIECRFYKSCHVQNVPTMKNIEMFVMNDYRQPVIYLQKGCSNDVENLKSRIYGNNV